MRVKRLAMGEERTYAVILDRGDEAIESLTDWATRAEIRAARLTGIGGFRRVTLGFFDPPRRGYLEIPVDEQAEVVALMGDIAMADGGPQVHAQVVVALSDGMTRGGHLLRAEVWPTLEVLVTQSPAYLARRVDAETGLPLIDLDADI
ncbi:MAG: uncharacterized protein QOE54_6483 [Streptosporangiaceae bacterium]|jgi:predicted DNA-binding protein with PD1-like motif|nr:DNA-binding protein [Streptosporangiaceae bacterium]MDX6434117.1 uncharacterized protein [Streptosporangiaceae bacterium]